MSTIGLISRVMLALLLGVGGLVLLVAFGFVVVATYSLNPWYLAPAVWFLAVGLFGWLAGMDD